MVKIMSIRLLLLLASLATATAAFQAPSQQPYPAPLKIRNYAHVYKYLGAGKKNKLDEFDMQELKARMDQEDNPFQEVFKKIRQKVVKRPKRVHVILFNPGTDQQGAHTIEYPRGSGSNVVLAFESRMSCVRFSSALKNQNFFDPTTHEFELDELAAFCEAVGVFVQVIPSGTELIPPSEHVKTFGNNRNLRRDKKRLEYTIEMLDSGQDSDGLILDLDGEFLDGAWL